jgi:hypothetical protein
MAKVPKQGLLIPRQYRMPEIEVDILDDMMPPERRSTHAMQQHFNTKSC